MHSTRRAFKSTIFRLLLVLVPTVVSATDTDEQYRVLTINSLETCSDLNTAVAISNDEDDWRLLYTFSVYTMGYLTAINRLAFDTYDIAAGKNVKTHMVWLQRYCAENPKDSYEFALSQLVAKLYPMRASMQQPAETKGN